MRGATLMQVAHRIASTTGRREGVSIVFEGNQAATDGKVIYLPAVEPLKVLSAKEAAVMMGYLDHESSHIRYTNFTAGEGVVWSKDVTSGKVTVKDPLLKHIWNLIEDVCVENSFIDRYPGAKEGLDALADFLDGKATEKSAVDDAPTLTDLMRRLYDEVWTYRGRDRMDANKLLADMKQGPEMVSLLKTIPLRKKTADRLELATKVRDLIRAAYKEEIKKANAAMSALSKMVGTELKVGQTTSIPKDVIDAIAALTNVDDVRTESAMEIAGATDSDKKGRGQKTQRNWGDRILPPVTTANDKVYYYAREDMGQYQQVLRNMREEMRRMTRALAIYLRSRDYVRWERGKEEGELDNQAVWSIRMKNPRIYRQKRTQLVTDSAVLVMLDLSSSMDEALTREAAVLLSEAAMQLPQLKLGIYGFTLGGGYNAHRPAGYGRVGGLRIPVFKGFNDSLKSARARLGAIATTGSTPLGEGYSYALEEIMFRPERKKFLIMVTDGEPSLQVADRNHSEPLLMQKVHQEAKKHGVETLGICIGTKAMAAYVDRNILIKDHSELSPAVLSLARDLMTKATIR